MYAGPIGVTGCEAANTAAEVDVVVAVGTRLEDFTTGSWTVFKNADVKIVGINTARWDATKHLALPVVGDAREALVDLTGRIGNYRAPESWSDTASAEVSQYHAYIDKIAALDANGDELPSYAQVVGVGIAGRPRRFCPRRRRWFPG